jgi:putative membrane protein
MFNYLRIFTIGFCMGVADLIPGVSGGTIAFISGIYESLINGIKRFDLKSLHLALSFRIKELRERIPFLFFIPLGLGLLTAVFSLSHILESLFETHPEKLWAYFFGLILGSIVLLFQETRPWNLRDTVFFTLSAVLTFFLVGLPATQTPASPLYLFLAGSIAICAMLLPGISGSYILVILGKYQEVLEIINARDVISLAYFMAGMCVGVLSLVRIISWLLRRFRHLTIIALTGIMAGALRTVWPWKEPVTTRIDNSGAVIPLIQKGCLPDDGGQLAIALLLLIVGAMTVIFLSRMKPVNGRRP